MSTFYIDASVPVAVRRAIAGCRNDVLYAGGPSAPPEDAKDKDWLPHAGAAGWIVIHRDKRIRRRREERRAWLDAGVCMFCLTTAGNATRWEHLEILIPRWTRMEDTIAADTGPYVYAVSLGRFERLPMPDERDQPRPAAKSQIS